MNSASNISHRISSVSIAIAVVVSLMMAGSLYKTVLLKISPPQKLVDIAVPLHSTSVHIAKRGNLLDRRGSNSRSE